VQSESWIKISLVCHTNQTKKRWKEQNKTKNLWAIKSGNGHKNLWDTSEKVRKTLWEGFMEKVSFESELEQRWSDA